MFEFVVFCCIYTHPHSTCIREQRIGKPRAALERLHDLVEKVHDSMCALADDMVLYENESIALMRGRWDKLCSELLQKSNFNISKIPDLYDSIKYDMTHNSHVLPPEVSAKRC